MYLLLQHKHANPYNMQYSKSVKYNNVGFHNVKLFSTFFYKYALITLNIKTM